MAEAVNSLGLIERGAHLRYRNIPGSIPAWVSVNRPLRKLWENTPDMRRIIRGAFSADERDIWREFAARHEELYPSAD